MFDFLRRRGAAAAATTETAPCVAASERIYAVGDVHGRADLLEALLAAIRADAATFADGRATRLVLLGDYVDRGEDSAAVLARVAALRADGAVCLKGNHEAALLDFLDAPEAGAGWLEMGGLQTLASYRVRLPAREPRSLRAAAAALREALGPSLALLRGLAPYHESGAVVFVHAALAPGRALAAQDEAALYWGDRAFLREAWRGDRLVVHGHYAAAEPALAPGRICVDTGAYYSGRLTAVRLDAGTAFLRTGG